MRLDGVILFSALCLLVSVSAERNDRCIAHDGSVGQCIYLTSCRELLELARSTGREQLAHEEAIDIIKKSSCGYVVREPLVCCPAKITTTGPDSDAANLPPYDARPSNQNSNTINEKPPHSGAPHGAAPLATTTTTIHPQSGLPLTTTTPSKSSGTTISPSQGFDSTIPPVGGSTLQPQTCFTTTVKPPVPTTQPAFESETASTTPESVTEIIPESTTSDVNENHKLLPSGCGRVLTYKYFYGNLTDLHDFPWVSLLEFNTPNGKKLGCGGSLISNRYVLTSGHCVRGASPAWQVSGVRFGEYNTATDVDCLPDGDGDNSVYCADKPVTIGVEETIVHPDFMLDDRNRLHDIALLRLAQPVTFTAFVRPICLPFYLPDPQRYYTSGWGKSFFNEGTNLKYMSYLTLDNNESCNAKYQADKIVVGESQMCAGAKLTEKSCIGDMGGPMMGIEEKSGQRKCVTVFGVLSRTHSNTSVCETNDWPGIYTKVQDYVPWILSQLRE